MIGSILIGILTLIMGIKLLIQSISLLIGEAEQDTQKNNMVKDINLYLELITSQYQNSPKFKKWVEVLLTPYIDTQNLLHCNLP